VRKVDPASSALACMAKPRELPQDMADLGLVVPHMFREPRQTTASSGIRPHMIKMIDPL
jgi:hypothetical protein